MDEEVEQQLLIPNYANWVVADARENGLRKGLKVEVENKNPPDATGSSLDGGTAIERAVIERNSQKSPPNTPIQPGGIVSVVIFPLEPRQG
ncbi:MAG: hypothetical protein KDC98_05315 [Planctomycetes bacterium]|nr:hypothetical protein [Planctomycetota bacterium]